MSLESLGLNLLEGIDLVLRNVLTLPPVGEQVDMNPEGSTRHQREVGEVIHLTLSEVIEKWIALYEPIELLVVWSILAYTLSKCVCRELLLSEGLPYPGSDQGREDCSILDLRPEDPHVFHLREGNDLSFTEWESAALEETCSVDLGKGFLAKLCRVLKDLREKRIGLVNIHTNIPHGRIH